MAMADALPGRGWFSWHIKEHFLCKQGMIPHVQVPASCMTCVGVRSCITGLNACSKCEWMQLYQELHPLT